MTHRREYSVDRLRTTRTLYKPLPVPIPALFPRDEVKQQTLAVQREFAFAANRARKECAL